MATESSRHTINDHRELSGWRFISGMSEAEAESEKVIRGQPSFIPISVVEPDMHIVDLALDSAAEAQAAPGRIFA